MYNISDEPNELTTQNLTFIDQNPSYNYDVVSNPDGTFDAASTEDVDLGDFFSRPTKIYENEWSTSVVFYENIDPWSLFFQNPRVINRINNYNLLRANLHLKFLINGNGFYYGRLIANYKPLPSFDTMIRDRALIPEDNVAASQRPHIYLDPTTSQGGEMVLPFFFYKNAVSIPDAQWTALGNLSIRELTSLKHANGSVDPVTISVFAWATDVQLAVPTSKNSVSLVSQSGYEKSKSKKSNKQRVTLTKNKAKSNGSSDEYGQGIISKPASTVARIAGMLSQAPIIGPYARATEIAASGVSGIAKLFGYSRPVNLEPYRPLTPRYVGDVASTNLDDTINKLTIDSKQELSVAGSTVGLSDVDEMTIKSISTRESYLTSFPWDMLTPVETVLWSSEVSPALWATTSSEVHMPACCFAVLPFYHWRGSMKFRFQVVASNYHRGRIKIVYEPKQISTTDEYNVNYVHVVDISEDKDFTVEVGWGNPLGYLRHKSPGVSTTPYTNGPAALTTNTIDLNNGLLYVSVVNELTSPNSTVNNDIKVNVFVSTGDDFEVKNPQPDLIQNLTLYTPQSGFEVQSGEEVVQGDAECTPEPSAPMQTSPIGTMAAKLDPMDPATRVYYGEEITSFRQCLKRYGYYMYLPLNSSSSNTGVIQSTYSLNSFPFNRGQATVNSAFGTSANYNKMLLMSYVSSAYAGWRGGIRWKLIHMLGNNAGAHGYLTVTRLPSEELINTHSEVVVSATAANVANAMRNVTELLPNTWGGAAVTPSFNQPALEFEVPYQDYLRFSPSRQRDYTSGASRSFYNPFRIDHYGISSVAGDAYGVQAWLAAGEDFSLFFFIGAPVYFVLASIP